MSDAPNGTGNGTGKGIGTGHNDPRGLRRWRDPARKHTFEELGDGTVRVTADDGRTGLFDSDGRYLSGDLTQTSKHMIVWTTAPWVPEPCDYRWPIFPVDINRPSGFPKAVEEILEQQRKQREKPR